MHAHHRRGRNPPPCRSGGARCGCRRVQGDRDDDGVRPRTVSARMTPNATRRRGSNGVDRSRQPQQVAEDQGSDDQADERLLVLSLSGRFRTGRAISARDFIVDSSPWPCPQTPWAEPIGHAGSRAHAPGWRGARRPRRDRRRAAVLLHVVRRLLRAPRGLVRTTRTSTRRRRRPPPRCVPATGISSPFRPSG